MSEVTYPAGQTGGASATEKTQEKAQEMAGQMQEKAGELKGAAGSRIREQLDDRSTQVGEQMSSVATAMRKAGQQLRSEGSETPARYVDGVGERIEQLGSYLTEANGDRMLRDIEDFGRRRPWAIALAGSFAGLVGARFLKASGRRRYEESVSGNGARQATAPPQYREL